MSCHDENRTKSKVRATALAVVVTASAACATAPDREEPRRPVGEPPSEAQEIDRAERRRSDAESDPDSERSDPGERDKNAGKELDRDVFPETRVTLDFRTTSVRRVLRIFREKADVEIVVAPDVRGRVTIRVREAPIDEAFRTVLEAADLTVRSRENALIVEPVDRSGSR